MKLSSQVHLHPYIFKTAFSFDKRSTTTKNDWIFSHFAISTNPLCSCISWILIELFRFFYPWEAWNCLVKDNWTKINQQYPEINRKWKMAEYVKCITLSNHSQSSTCAASFITINPLYLIVQNYLDPFHATGLFWYPLWLTDVFRRYRKRAVTWNSLLRKSIKDCLSVAFCIKKLSYKNDWIFSHFLQRSTIWNEPLIWSNHASFIKDLLLV